MTLFVILTGLYFILVVYLYERKISNLEKENKELKSEIEKLRNTYTDIFKNATRINKILWSWIPKSLYKSINKELETGKIDKKNT